MMRVQHFAQAIAGAESLDRLAEVVRHMVEVVKAAPCDWVDATRARLQADQSQAQPCLTGCVSWRPSSSACLTRCRPTL